MESGIIIENNLSFLSRNAVFGVFLDGKEIALMNKKISINIEAGIYAVQLKTSWFQTQVLIVNVKESETVLLRIRNGINYYKPTYTIFIIGMLISLVLMISRIINPVFVSIFYIACTLPLVVNSLYYFIFKRGQIWILEDAQ